MLRKESTVEGLRQQHANKQNKRHERATKLLTLCTEWTRHGPLATCHQPFPKVEIQDLHL